MWVIERNFERLHYIYEKLKSNSGENLKITVNRREVKFNNKGEITKIIEEEIISNRASVGVEQIGFVRPRLRFLTLGHLFGLLDRRPNEFVARQHRRWE